MIKYVVQLEFTEDISIELVHHGNIGGHIRSILEDAGYLPYDENEGEDKHVTVKVLSFEHVWK